MERTIERVFRGAPEHWVGNGFRVSNYFPSATDFEKRMSPFFLLDYHAPRVYDATTKRRGVGTHPHRGFETVTIAYQGAVAHRDSTGAGFSASARNGRGVGEAAAINCASVAK